MLFHCVLTNYLPMGFPVLLPTWRTKHKGTGSGSELKYPSMKSCKKQSRIITKHYKLHIILIIPTDLHHERKLHMMSVSFTPPTWIPHINMAHTMSRSILMVCFCSCYVGFLVCFLSLSLSALFGSWRCERARWTWFG